MKKQGSRKINISSAATNSTSTKPAAQSSHARERPSSYRLQVRLFDGSSVRSSFSPFQSIRGDVRPWLDAQLTADNSRPYNLKYILTPLPSRTLSITEEEQTLQDLGIGPSANLVMVPIQSYSEAYGSSGPSLPVRGAYAIYGLVSSAVGGLAGSVGSFLGYGQTEGSSTSSGSHSSDGQRRVAVSQSARIRTLGDQNEAERDDQQFYNGNQVWQNSRCFFHSAETDRHAAKL